MQRDRIINQPDDYTLPFSLRHSATDPLYANNDVQQFSKDMPCQKWNWSIRPQKHGVQLRFKYVQDDNSPSFYILLNASASSTSKLT